MRRIGSASKVVEVGMARSVHDVENLALIVNGRVLGLDGNATLLLLVHAVHGALRSGLIFTVGAACFQEAIDEGGLAVVNVGNDGKVSNVFGTGHGLWGMEEKGRGA